MTGRTTEQTYLADPRTWFRRALIAPALLFSLILIIGVGPRISLGFVDAEIRIQDALLPPILLYLVFSRKPVIRLPLDRMLGLLLPVFLWASFIVVVIGLFFYQIGRAHV